jgi:glycosyltransferase involved in cell wall biosynthesis
VSAIPSTLVLTSSYPAFPGDASGHFVESEARQLARRGPVLVLAAGEGRTQVDPTSPEAPCVQWLGGARLFGFPGALSKLRENPFGLFALPGVLGRAWIFLRRHSGDIQAHWLLPFGFLAALSTLGRKQSARGKLSIIAHGSDVRLVSRAPRAIKSLIVRSLFRSRAELTFVSSELRDNLAHGLDAELSQYVKAGRVRAAALEIDGRQGSREEARAVLGIDRKKTLAIVVGRLVSDKRSDVALNALSLLPELDIVCVGDGPLRKELASRFPNVHFVGQCPRPRALTWIQAADVLVSASRLEGAPTAIREALALGTLAVSVQASDLALWAREERNLFLVPLGAAN